MVSIGRIAAISSITTTLGFVSGAWFISSGYGFQLLPVPALPAPATAPASPTCAGPSTSGSPSKTLAVAMPLNLQSQRGLLWWPESEGQTIRPLADSGMCLGDRPPPAPAVRGGWFKNDTERHIVGYPIIEPWSGSTRFLLIEELCRPRGR